MNNEFSIISLQNVFKVFQTPYEKIILFENFSLNIKGHKTTAIVGESGSGKTTLLNLMSGLDSVTSGKIFFQKEELSQMSEKELSLFRAKHVGFIFQNHFLLNDFNALENVLLPFRILGLTIRENYAKELFEKVHLQDRLYHYPYQLSGGEKQRIAILRAMVHNPDVVFADEPLGGLDKSNAEEVEKLLFDLVAEEEKTLILSTHNMKLARKTNQIIVLE